MPTLHTNSSVCEGRGLPKNTNVSNCDVLCGERVIGTTPLQQSRNPIWGDSYSLYVQVSLNVTEFLQRRTTHGGFGECKRVGGNEEEWKEGFGWCIFFSGRNGGCQSH